MRSQYYGKNFSALLREFGSAYPLLHKFDSTPQDDEWHREGNVAIHTDMVLQEVYSLIDEYQLSVEDQDVLILGALLHDYAKPITTKPVLIQDKTRIGAPRHEEVGASLLFFLDPPDGIDQQKWRVILDLVAFHQVPKMLVVKDKTKSDYFSFARSVSRVDLIYFLEIADMKGRICRDKSEQLDYLELFRLYCLEYGVWDKSPYLENRAMITSRMPHLPEKKIHFLDEQMRSRFEDGQIWGPEAEIERAFNYIDKQNHLVIMCGLPGSGKSTFIKNKFSGYEIISLDEIRKEFLGSKEDQTNVDAIARIAHQRLKSLLREKKNIVWDATNLRRDFREKISQIGFDYKAFVEIIVIHCPLSLSIKQNNNRPRVVPEEVIGNMVEIFQLPTLAECHSLTFEDCTATTK